VLLLDPEDRLLLMRFYAPKLDRTWWLTPGGGLDPGETPEQAALRELAEETGLVGVGLGPCVWVREHVFDWEGRRYRQMERYYVARTLPFELAPTLPDGSELFQMMEHRWWSLDELEAATDAVFAPRRLPALMRSLLHEGWPAEPVDTGL
jgi:8-oxo-dGTP pyrophosphatase MutT (NUDIX family)